MFLSLNIDQKIAFFESLKEQEGNSSDNFFCSTNSQSENIDIGDLFIKRSLNRDDNNSINSVCNEDLQLPAVYS